MGWRGGGGCYWNWCNTPQFIWLKKTFTGLQIIFAGPKVCLVKCGNIFTSPRFQHQSPRGLTFSDWFLRGVRWLLINFCLFSYMFCVLINYVLCVNFVTQYKRSAEVHCLKPIWNHEKFALKQKIVWTVSQCCDPPVLNIMILHFEICSGLAVDWHFLMALSLQQLIQVALSLTSTNVDLWR